MKLKRNSEKNDVIVTANELLIGELAEMIEPNYAGEIVIRAYRYIVSLSEPNHVWDSPSALKVKKLAKGTTFILEQE